MDSTKPTIAFFGATGGCAASALALSLKNGYTCSALARSPTKLTDLLTKQHSVSSDILSKQLTIVTGDIRDSDAVKSVLAPNNDNIPASIIITGIGGTSLRMQCSLAAPVALTDPTICHDAAVAILAAMRSLRAEAEAAEAAEAAAADVDDTSGEPITPARRPLLVAISSTGTDRACHDVPLGYGALYHWLLASPHEDKRLMESEIVRCADGADGDEAPFEAYTIIRPTLLFDGEPKGVAKVRAGWVLHPEAKAKPAQAGKEDGKGGKPPGAAVGYSIRRADVGAWIFEECVVRGGSGWENRCVSLTY